MPLVPGSLCCTRMEAEILVEVPGSMTCAVKQANIFVYVPESMTFVAKQAKILCNSSWKYDVTRESD